MKPNEKTLMELWIPFGNVLIDFPTEYKFTAVAA